MKVKCEGKVIKSILVVAVLMFGFLVTIPNVRAVTIVDFDALDTSGAATVSGATLDSYLTGYGVTLTNNNVTTSPVFVGDSDNDPNATASSGTNWLGQSWGGVNGVSYQLDFDNVLDSLSFTRVGIGFDSAVRAPEWSVTVYNSSNVSLGSVGEPLRSVWSYEPPVIYNFNTSGITHMVVFSNVGSQAGMGGMPIDDIVMEQSGEPIPEPTTMALLGIGLAGLGGRYLRRKHKKDNQ